MDIKVNLMKMELHCFIKDSYIIYLIVDYAFYVDFGLFASCLISPTSLPLKIAIGGFVGGILIFVCPLYYMAVKGRN
jgi:hypothetical protein